MKQVLFSLAMVRAGSILMGVGSHVRAYLLVTMSVVCASVALVQTTDIVAAELELVAGQTVFEAKMEALRKQLWVLDREQIRKAEAEAEAEASKAEASKAEAEAQASKDGTKASKVKARKARALARKARSKVNKVKAKLSKARIAASEARADTEAQVNASKAEVKAEVKAQKAEAEAKRASNRATDADTKAEANKARAESNKARAESNKARAEANKARIKAKASKVEASKAAAKAESEVSKVRVKATKAKRSAEKLAYAKMAGIRISGEKAEFPPEAGKDWTRILGSKHDLTALNKRAGANAMGGVAFTEYDNPCVYCHVPSEASDSKNNSQRILGWNRVRSQAQQYEMYDSATMDRAAPRPQDIGSVTALCLSCHDGTQAVDRLVFKPSAWQSNAEQNLHLRMNASDDLQSCGKCHNGIVAHNITAALSPDLRNDHPISIPYAGLDAGIDSFMAPDYENGFSNGIKLYDGRVECATCHDIHDPSARLLLRTDAEFLCATCHVL